MNALDLSTTSEKATSLAALILDPEELDFPIKDQIQERESGQGYALRMAFDNQLKGLPQIKRWLGKSRYAVLDQADARLLHRWFGANEKALGTALGHATTGAGYEGYSFAGHRLARSYFLNRSYPRVCLQCLSSTGYCASTWDLSLVVACPVHRTLLIDRCPHCQRSLTWHRPGPNTCACGCDLSSQAEQEPQIPSALEVQFGAWAATATVRTGEVRPDLNVAVGGSEPCDSEVLIDFLRTMSLNGGLLFTYALATAAGYGDLERDLRIRPQLPLSKARRVLSSANQVAHRLSRDWKSMMVTKRPSVVIQLLADCMAADMPRNDRNLANSVLSTMLFQRRRTTWKSRYPQLSQLDLF